MSCLTQEQRNKIEKNRQNALKKRAELLKLRSNIDNKNCSSIAPTSTGRPTMPWHIPQKVGSLLLPGTASALPGKKILGSCLLWSKNRFTVKMPYHAQAVEIFKTFSSKQYDVNLRQWSFSIDDYSKLFAAVNQLKPEVCIDSLPSFILQALKKSRKYSPFETISLMCIDANILESLMPFQRVGVCFGVSRNGRVLIADDMGLGKTIQALGIASYYRSEWPLLIVAPSSLRYAWAEALERWITDVDVYVANTGKDSISGSVVILSYDLLTRRAQEIKDMQFKVVIMDESHMLKNFKSQRYKAAASIMKEAKRLILLSGTPALSRPSELYTQISSLDAKLIPNFHEYGLRYCAAKQQPWGYDYSGSSNMEELQVLIESTIMIRRLKSEVLSQLPAKQRMTVLLDPSLVKSKDGLQSAARNLSEKSIKGHEKRGALLEYFSETAAAKSKAVCNYIKEILEEGEKKFLVFAHHKVMLNEICCVCEELNTNYICISGSTSPDARQKLVDLFQENPATKVAVLSITAASTGITLTAAQLVIFAELYWNPGYLIQAEDRVHRIGQLDSVLVQYLVAKGTADDYIWPLVQNKLQILNKGGFSKENFSNASTSNQKLKLDGDILSYFKEFNEEIDQLDSAPSHKKQRTDDTFENSQ